MSLAQIRDAVGRLEKLLEDRDDRTTHQLLHKVLEQMSVLSDAVAALTSAVADNTSATNDAVAKITAITQPSDAADVAAAVTAVGSATTQVAANTSALNSAQPATP